MESSLNCNSIMQDSIVDGPGLRCVVFVQGCPHHCPGCHNPQTHAFTPTDIKTVEEIFQMYQENPLLSGITFSGGEPFCQAGPLARLGQLVKKAGGDVITFTGYYYEDLLEKAQTDQDILSLLNISDYLIDGPFIEEEKDMELSFRGSRNQRIWDLHRHTIVDSL